MRLYLDASIILRRALHQPAALEHLAHPITTSELAQVECLRSLDRYYLLKHITEDDLALARASVFSALESAADIIRLHPVILRRAADPFPTPLGTLDAIHLATALILVREEPERPLTFGTHDRELARCARACGLDVVGV